MLLAPPFAALCLKTPTRASGPSSAKGHQRHTASTCDRFKLVLHGCNRLRDWEDRLAYLHNQLVVGDRGKLLQARAAQDQWSAPRSSHGPVGQHVVDIVEDERFATSEADLIEA